MVRGDAPIFFGEELDKGKITMTVLCVHCHVQLLLVGAATGAIFLFTMQPSTTFVGRGGAPFLLTGYRPGPARRLPVQYTFSTSVSFGPILLSDPGPSLGPRPGSDGRAASVGWLYRP